MKRENLVVLLLVLVLALGLVGRHDRPMLIQSAYAQPLSDVTAFAQDWATLSEDDDTDLARQPRAIFACADGNLVVSTWVNPGGSATTFPVTAGNIYPISPGRIKEATTASCLIALY